MRFGETLPMLKFVQHTRNVLHWSTLTELCNLGHRLCESVSFSSSIAHKVLANLLCHLTELWLDFILAPLRTCAAWLFTTCTTDYLCTVCNADSGNQACIHAAMLFFFFFFSFHRGPVTASDTNNSKNGFLLQITLECGRRQWQLESPVRRWRVTTETKKVTDFKAWKRVSKHCSAALTVS